MGVHRPTFGGATDTAGAEVPLGAVCARGGIAGQRAVGDLDDPARGVDRSAARAPSVAADGAEVARPAHRIVSRKRRAGYPTGRVARVKYARAERRPALPGRGG